MDYYQYLKSKEWQLKRAERLEIDGHKCVICKGGEKH